MKPLISTTFVIAAILFGSCQAWALQSMLSIPEFPMFAIPGLGVAQVAQFNGVLMPNFAIPTIVLPALAPSAAAMPAVAMPAIAISAAVMPVAQARVSVVLAPLALALNGGRLEAAFDGRPERAGAPTPAKSGRIWNKAMLDAFLVENNAAIRAVAGVKNVEVVERDGLPPVLIVTVQQSNSVAQVKKEMETQVPAVQSLNGIMGAPSQILYQN